MQQVMTRLGLTLNNAKTAIRDARTEQFDFLGYSFGPHHYRKDGHWYLGASPSKKSVARLKRKVNDVLVPGNQTPWSEVCRQLNWLVRGWSTYFSYGTRLMAYRTVNNHVDQRTRHFLVRRHKVPTRGTRRFSLTQSSSMIWTCTVCVASISAHHRVPCHEAGRKAGCRKSRTVRFDEQDWETELR